ncbi:MAG: class I SAM-dependent methyltransferase, partial [Pseudobdellovibrionaceae bacterium]
MSNEVDQFISVDEFGQVFESTDADQLVALPSLASNPRLQQFYQNLILTEKAALKTVIDGQTYYVEAFDAPIMIEKVFPNSKDMDICEVETTTGFKKKFSFKKIYFDEWDRFYTFDSQSLPMVFSEDAQNELFEMCDEYDDESLTIDRVRYQNRSLYPDQNTVEKSAYWENTYQNEEKPGWDLNQPSPALADMLPRLKLPKSRILVLGCGYGHDAAFFAENGHIVTAVDFSELAIARAKERYQHYPNIQFHVMDAMTLPNHFTAAFDVVCEHTCFCALNPSLRKQLVKTWQRCLVPNGTLFGVFFSMFKFQGPPFGATEWEIRKRLGNP